MLPGQNHDRQRRFVLPLVPSSLRTFCGVSRSISRAALTGLLLGSVWVTEAGAADGVPVVDAQKRVTLGAQPLSALLTQRFVIESSIRVTEHHAFVVAPYAVYFTTLDYLAILQGARNPTKDILKGQGLEFGYRYRTVPVSHSHIAVARFYGDARLLVSQFTLRHTNEDALGNLTQTPALPYSRHGFAFEFGAEATIAPGFYFALTGGFEYTYTSRSFDGAQKLAATSAIYGEGFRPRVGGATGFTF